MGVGLSDMDPSEVSGQTRRVSDRCSGGEGVASYRSRGNSPTISTAAHDPALPRCVRESNIMAVIGPSLGMARELWILLANSRRPPIGRSLGEMGYPG